MEGQDDFYEPPTGANFLERYRKARPHSNPSSPKQGPTSPPQTPKTGELPKIKLDSSPTTQSPQAPKSPRVAGRNRAESVWHSVFHPLGKSPKTADRYDLGRGNASPMGESASEIHAKGAGNNLDVKKED